MSTYRSKPKKLVGINYNNFLFALFKLFNLRKDFQEILQKVGRIKHENFLFATV